MIRHFLDFERPIAELESKIEELRYLSTTSELNIADEVGRLEVTANRLLRQTYARLTPWQKVQVARHPERPHCLDYVGGLITDFVPLAGDRTFAEDRAVIGGIGRFRGRSVVALGTEKGADTQARLRHNFGMAKPEGYRKARRLMRLAERFKLPVLTFVDTSGAFPGIDAEARGQAEAIARAIETCLDIRVPFVASIIGEGGSGGAIAIAAGNTVLMLEHAIYSVIPPEGCSAILWRDGKHAAEAAEALRLTAQNLLRLRVIEFDRVDPWPRGEAIAAFPLLAGKFARKHPNLGSFRRVNGAISYCPNCLFEQIPLLGGTAELFRASSGIFWASSGIAGESDPSTRGTLFRRSRRFF